MAAKLIQVIGDEPVTLAQAKLNLRLIADSADNSAHPDDALIESLITAARESAEQITGRGLIKAQWEIALPNFPAYIELPYPPSLSVDAITYRDTDGQVQTMPSADYELDAFSFPGRVFPVLGKRWPATGAGRNAVQVTFTTGHEGDVPQAVVRWMLLRIGTLYEKRVDVSFGSAPAPVPYVDRLLDAATVWR